MSDTTMVAGCRQLVDLPGPRQWSVLGNALQVDRQRFHSQLEGWAHQYGAPYTFRIAARQFVVVTAPEIIGSVLRNRPDGFRRTRRLEQVSRETGFLGLFSANGEHWRRQRPMVLTSLDPSHIRNFFPTLIEVTGKLRRRWMTAAERGASIDLQADLMKYTVDVTTALAFGENLNTLEGAEEEAIQQHLNVVMPHLLKRVLAPFDPPRWVRAASEYRFRTHIAALNQAVEGFIVKARAQLAANHDLREHPRNLIQALVAARDREASQVTDEDVSGNILTMLLAGEDTTANSLAWMIWLLHSNPHAAAAARVEVDRVLGGGELVRDIDQLAQLDMVEACANEAMRLKPVAPFILNEALSETIVGDVLVPKGAMVLCLMRPAGLRAEVFPDPHAFDPFRWITGAAPHGTSSPKRHTMPFGAGARMCPGRYLAMAEIKMVAAMLLANFEVEDVSTQDAAEPKEKISIVMSPEGLRMRLRAR